MSQTLFALLIRSNLRRLRAGLVAEARGQSPQAKGEREERIHGALKMYIKPSCFKKSVKEESEPEPAQNHNYRPLYKTGREAKSNEKYS